MVRDGERRAPAPNKSEMLFHAMLLCCNAESVKELDKWAGKVVLERSAAEAQQHRWKPSEAWPTANRVSLLFKPMELAFTGVRELERLKVVAAAMRFWDGDGRDDNMLGSHLVNYMHRKLLGVSGNAKKPNNGPPRWRTWCIVKVAAIILTHGVALRKALRLDGMEVDEVPTAHDRALAAEARVAKLESEKLNRGDASEGSERKAKGGGS